MIKLSSFISKGLSRNFKHSTLSSFSLIIGLIGMLLFKVVIVIVTIFVANSLENYLGNLGAWVIGWISGLIAGGLFIGILQSLNPYYEKLDNYIETFKEYPFSKKYGQDYPQPKPDDFGITKEEFNSYNGRFQFEGIKLIFTYGLFIGACVYVMIDKTKIGFIVLGISAILAIVLDKLFEILNKRISQRHPFYGKISKFQESNRIYYRIREEITRF